MELITHFTMEVKSSSSNADQSSHLLAGWRSRPRHCVQLQAGLLAPEEVGIPGCLSSFLARDLLWKC